MMITYVKGDATRPLAIGPKIIVHVCNDIGAWGKGFVLALSARWKEPEEEYRKWHREKTPIPFVLGNVLFVSVEKNLWVASLIGQRHIKIINDVPPIRYEAVKKGLEQIAAFAKEHQASVHMPRIGCGLAGGTWDRIKPLIMETLVQNEIPVIVYDLP